MKTTVKRNLVIFHDSDDWQRVLDRLAEDFGQTIRMRHIMRRELGFTARDHRGLVPHRKLDEMWAVLQSQPKVYEDASAYHYEYQVHLDFYNESAHSWFVLKYLTFE